MVIAITIIVVLAELPYNSLFEPNIAVNNHSSGVNVSAIDFNQITSDNALTFNNTTSYSTMTEKNGIISQLSISISGFLFWGPFTGMGTVIVNVSINGSIATNIYPKALILNISAYGPNISKDSYFEGLIGHMPRINTSSSNSLHSPYLSNNSSTFSSASESIKLLNSPQWKLIHPDTSIFYNFSYYSRILIFMYSHKGNFDFRFSSQLTGLRGTPEALVNLRIISS